MHSLSKVAAVVGLSVVLFKVGLLGVCFMANFTGKRLFLGVSAKVIVQSEQINTNQAAYISVGVAWGPALNDAKE